MELFKYGITDSTSTRAKEYAARGGRMPALFIANGQTSGRGRRGRSFDSADGKGLYMTLLFKPEKSECDPAVLTVRAAVALARSLRSVAGLSVGIKWVNDIFVSSKKLAGILAEGEMLASGAMSYAMIGVGVNLLSREFPPELCDIVTTVQDSCGKIVSPDALANAFVSEFFAASDIGEVLKEYRELSVVIGKRVLVRRISGEEFFADVVDITDSAALLVRRDDGSLEELISAEVSIKNN